MEAVPSKEKNVSLSESLKTHFNNNRNMILVCLIATFAWGLIAHAYMFLNTSFSHDSLAMIGVDDDDWKIQLGRILSPVFRKIFRNTVTLPWLVGLLALFFIFVAVFFVVKTFNVKSKLQVVLIAGIFTANITVISTTASYINDLDVNMLALAFAACAVYLWKRFKWGFLWGILFAAATLSIYQCYISVAITLILLCLIFELLNSLTFRKALLSALKGVGMLIGGGILYILAVMIVCSATGLELASGTQNSLTGMFSLTIGEILQNLWSGYGETIKEMVSYASIYTSRTILILNIVTIGITLIILLIGLFQKSVHWKEKISVIVLTLLLPIGMNVSYILTNGYSNDVMYYALCLIYLLVLLLAWWQVGAFQWIKPFIGRAVQAIMVVLICIVLFVNVQTANAVYLQKDLIGQGTLSLMTRIVEKIDDYDGYVSGETPVVFIGNINDQLTKIPGLENVYKITGAGSKTSLGVASYNGYYQWYFKYILQDPAIIADNTTWQNMQTNEEANDLPCFPEEGSVDMIDGVLVVKVGS